MKKDPVTEPLARLLRNLGSEGSRLGYKNDWERYRKWLAVEKVDVLKVKPRHIEAHIMALQDDGDARSTCGRALSVIREVYGILVRDELMEVNPAREVKNPKFDGGKPKTPWLDEDQIKKILNIPCTTWHDRRDHMCLCLLCGLGIRRAEIARINIEDFRVRGQNTELEFVSKGGKSATVGVPQWLTEKITEWAEYAGIKSGALLPRSATNAASINGDIIYKIVRAAGIKAGLPKKLVKPHAFRRTAITLAYKEGVSIDDLQRAAAHSNKSTTEHYIQAVQTSETAPGDWMKRLIGDQGSKK